MTQSLSEALAEAARVAALADVVERDRIAWNLPPNAVEEPPLSDRDEVDGPERLERDEPRR